MIFEFCMNDFRPICPRIDILKGKGMLCKKVAHIKARIIAVSTTDKMKKKSQSGKFIYSMPLDRI